MVHLYIVWWCLVCLGIGYMVLSLLRWNGNTCMTIALSYYLGFAILGYSAVTLGLVGKFTVPWLVGLLVTGSVIAGYGYLRWWKIIKQWKWSLTPRWQWILGGLAIFLLAANYLACFALPTARDAISYHIPEAQAIINAEQLTFPLGGHIFYGNIPVLMEVIYALGISLGGFSLAQLLHYSLYLAFLIFLYGWLKERYNLTTASWGVLSVPLLHTVLSAAITLDIDAAHMVLEVIAVLLVVDWISEPKTRPLWPAGAVLGLALSIKYSPLATVAILGLAIVATLIVRRIHLKKSLGVLAQWLVPMMIIGSFWYLKNAIMLLNPLYPLYFGHAGYDPVQFQALLQAIQDFRVPRTLWNWMILPYNVYWPGNSLVSALARPTPLVIWSALLSLPLLLWVKPYLRHGLMVSYGLIYTAYWFFFATHQSRFLDPANLMLVILAVIALTQLPRYWGAKLVGGILGLVMILTLVTGTFRTAGNLGFVAFRTYVVHWSEVKYALGISSKADYLRDYLDCGIDAAYFLEEQGRTEAVLDNWTVWHNHHFKYYAHNNSYLSFSPNLTTEQVAQFITDHQIKYVYFNTESKQDFSVTPDVTQQEYYAARIQQEDALLLNASLLYQSGSCQLYALPPTS